MRDTRTLLWLIIKEWEGVGHHTPSFKEQDKSSTRTYPQCWSSSRDTERTGSELNPTVQYLPAQVSGQSGVQKQERWTWVYHHQLRTWTRTSWRQNQSTSCSVCTVPCLVGTCPGGRQTRRRSWQTLRSRLGEEAQCRRFLVLILTFRVWSSQCDLCEEWQRNGCQKQECIAPS